MPGLKLDRKGKLLVPETSLEAAIFQLLSYDDWHVFRAGWAITQAGRELGSVGMPDLLALRYGPGLLPESGHLQDEKTFRMIGGCAQVLWLEIKTAHRKPTLEQKLWHIAERRCGAIVIVAGEDFRADVESFRAWYAGSGLARRES